VKQFDAVRDGLTMFSGATILGDGAPALIVDVGSLL
jgi:two-component system chemotaxis sensor kinase CheA